MSTDALQPKNATASRPAMFIVWLGIIITSAFVAVMAAWFVLSELKRHPWFAVVAVWAAVLLIAAAARDAIGSGHHA